MKNFLRKHFDEIISLTDSEFDYIFAYYKGKKFKKHQFVIQEGELVMHNYFVWKGCLKAYHTDNKGKDHVLQFALPNWWITDYQAYYNTTAASINIDCIEDSELLYITLENCEKICSEIPKMSEFYRKKANKGYVALQQRILSLLNSSANERYEQMFKLYPQLFQKVPKQLIAAYLGVTRETLSRLSAISK